MNKKVISFIAGTSAVVSLIYISGYGYIFKAIRKNLMKGPLTPSTDDVEKFPFHVVPNQDPHSFIRDCKYNSQSLSEVLYNDLKKTRTSSLIVLKENRLIYEKYWKKHSSDSLLNSFSMAKGILALLIGCAIDDGYLHSENQLISSLLPKYKKSNYGKFLTLKHLLTMQAGMDWNEEYHHPFAPNSKQYFVEDLAEQALSIDIIEMPGKEYQYQSVSAQLLGLALKKAIGKDLSKYLSEKIWRPLRMEFPAKWTIDENGLEKSFCCIHAVATDFAKIGQLILQEGNWEGRQIICKAYLERMLTPTKENDSFCYSIWADDDNEIKYRFFYGFLGQFIIVIPEKRLVITKTGFYNRLEVDEKLRPTQVRLLVNELSALF